MIFSQQVLPVRGDRQSDESITALKVIVGRPLMPFAHPIFL